MTQMLVEATAAFLRGHAPFDEIDAAALDFLVGRLRLRYFEPGASIIEPAMGAACHFHIVQRGRVLAHAAGELGAADHATMTLGAGECFPIGAATAQRPTTNRYSAIDDVFCYLLTNEDFQALLGISAEFNRFCTRYIASLLSQSRRELQLQFSQRASELQLLSSSLDKLIRRPAVAVGADLALGDALRQMAGAEVVSVVVCDRSRRPVGIFTRSDLLRRVVLPGLALDSPIASVMSPAPQTLPVDASGHDAAMAMARHAIRHVLAVDADGRLVGVISERDLFAIQRIGLSQVRAAIETAPDIARLQQSAADVRQLALNLLAQGVGAEQITQFVAALNDALSRRVIELALAVHDLYGVDWTWLAFGSEGREEQTFSTDQDNGIIFLCPDFADRDELRLRLLAFARDVNRDLDRCGFPLCTGDVMAGNAEWCLTLEEWQERFANWIRIPDRVALLNATIFFDFRVLHGLPGLAHRLRKTLFELAPASPQFLMLMTRNALDAAPPLGRFQDFVVGDDPRQPKTLDLKKSGARLFTDAARIYAVGRGLFPTNTAQRLRLLAQQRNEPPGETAAMIAAFHFIQMLRLRQQCLELEAGTGGGNRLDPDRLNELDRRILKESFRQARKLQQRLRMDFQA